MIAAACVLSTAFQALGFLIFQLSVPRSYYVLYFFLMLLTTCATRFSYRILRSFQNKLQKSDDRPIHTMVIGAGEAGSIIIHELKSSQYLNRKVVCAIDDNISKKGKYLQGVKIVGNREDILTSVEKYGVEEIIFAIPSASPKTTKEILNICNQTDCKLSLIYI